jgi:predicted phage-related endonuclease
MNNTTGDGPTKDPGAATKPSATPIVVAGITASDVVAILGLDPINGPLAIFGSKMGSLTPNLDVYAATLREYGANCYELQTERHLIGIHLYRSGWRVADTGWVAARRNAPMPRLDENQEAFFTGIEACPWAERLLQIEVVRARESHLWGEEVAGHISPRQVHSVPYQAVIKAIWNMHVTKIWRCDLVAVLEDQIRIYPIEYDQLFAQAIEDGVSNFYQENILKNVLPPADWRPSSYEYLASAFHEVKEGYFIDPTEESIGIAQHLRATNSLLRQHRLQAEELVNKLCAKMGEAEGIEGICTWKKDISGTRRFRLLGDDN